MDNKQISPIVILNFSPERQSALRGDAAIKVYVVGVDNDGVIQNLSEDDNLRDCQLDFYAWPNYDKKNYNVSFDMTYSGAYISNEHQAMAIAKQFRRVRIGLERIAKKEGDINSYDNAVELFLRTCRVLKITKFYLRIGAKPGDRRYGYDNQEYLILTAEQAQAQIMSWLMLLRVALFGE